MVDESNERTSYNTNLASEFFVLSVLYRLGAEAYLTLGNKKSVDIVLKRRSGTMVTIDVKGQAGARGGFDGGRGGLVSPTHYFILVDYGGKIAMPEVAPEVFVVPSEDVAALLRDNPSGRKTIPTLPLGRFKNAWHLLDLSA